MTHHHQLEGFARPCATRSAALTGRGPRAPPANPPQPVLNMTVRCSFQPGAGVAEEEVLQTPLDASLAEGVLTDLRGPFEANASTFEAAWPQVEAAVRGALEDAWKEQAEELAGLRAQIAGREESSDGAEGWESSGVVVVVELLW